MPIVTLLVNGVPGFKPNQFFFIFNRENFKYIQSGRIG